MNYTDYLNQKSTYPNSMIESSFNILVVLDFSSRWQHVANEWTLIEFVLFKLYRWRCIKIYVFKYDYCTLDGAWELCRVV